MTHIYRAFIYLFIFLKIFLPFSCCCADESDLLTPYIYNSVNVLTGAYVESATDLELAGFHPLILRRCIQSETNKKSLPSSGWHTNLPSLFISTSEYEKLMPIPGISYEYNDDGLLTKVCSLFGKEKRLNRFVDISYHEESESSVCKLTADDGQFLCYKYHIDDSVQRNPSLYITSIEKNGSPLVNYSYEPHPLTRSLVITKREEPNGRYLIIEYYDKKAGHGSIGKVKALKAPAGHDLSPIVTHRFFYGDGFTEVRDANNHKVIYRYGDLERLTSIEQYDDNEKLYRVERFVFEKSPTSSTPLMRSRHIEDSSGKIAIARFFSYNDYGALVKEKFQGDITGSHDPLECTVTNYHRDGQSLTLVEDGDIKTRYTYDKNERLISEHSLIDGFFHSRKFYAYDDDGLLIRTIIDDGASDFIHDLTRVQKRLIIKTAYSNSPLSYGMPETIEECYLDLSSNEEKLIQKTIITYSLKGRISSEKRFDSLGLLLFEKSYDYDLSGRPLLLCENEEVTTIEYDSNGNIAKKSVQKSDGALSCQTYEYDYLNRIIIQQEIDSQGCLRKSRNSYDFLGNKISATDVNENTIEYRYDFLGRLIELTSLPILDSNGQIKTPSTFYQYDINDAVISSTDPCGWTTSAAYNAFGKPIRIDYPDGTKETFKYNLKGELVEERSRSGLISNYKLDGLGRHLKVQTKTPQGHLLSETSATYSTFHLLTETNPLGKRDVYRYDAAGRVLSVTEQTLDEYRKTSFLYDNCGNVIERYFKQLGKDLLETFEYDEKGNLIKTTMKDESGNILYEKTAPEHAPNPRSEEREKQEFNEFGQIISYSELIDQYGNSIKTIKDNASRPSVIILKDPFGTFLRKIEYRYDLTGNKTEEIHHREGDAPFILAWEFGPRNRLEASIEGKGSPNQRVTTYQYNSKGNLKKTIKPDGSFLLYKYYPTGQIKRLISSDSTIDYTYEYDAAKNITLIADGLTKTQTKRSYTPYNQVAHEKLANGLMIKFSYDLLGQKTCLHLPDHSLIAYHYLGNQLEKVSRLDPLGKTLYTHTYDKYHRDSLKSATLIGTLGTVEYSYLENGKVAAIKSPYWKELNEFDSKNHLIRTTTTDTAGTHTSSFEYNSIGELSKEETHHEAFYTYDQLGNRESSDLDPLNQLIQNENTTFTFDANGNLESLSDENRTLFFAYDALDRLISTIEPGTQKTTYSYDGFNRRTSKTVFFWTSKKGWEEESTVHYLYDNLREIGSFDSDLNIKELRVLGLGAGAEIGAAVAIELDGNIYAPLHDHRGNVTALVSMDDGTCVESYRYSAYGKRLLFDKDGQELSESLLKMPWGFSSKRHDDETGFVFFGFRYYDPCSGRWTTLDPLKHADGPNRYTFVHNNPIDNRDLFGEFTWNEALESSLRMLQRAYNLTRTAISLYQQKFGYVNYAQSDIKDYCSIIAGPVFLRMAGFHTHRPESGVIGKGEVSDNVRVTMINGILNVHNEYLTIVNLFSKTHGNVNIHYVFRPTDGWTLDLCKCVLSKLGFVSTQSELLAKTWRRLLYEMGTHTADGSGLVIHYAHSIGGTETRNAMALMTPEERAFIKIVTFGSPTLIPESDFYSIANYVSWRDGVSYFDPITYARALLNQDTNIHFIGTRSGFPIMDHLLDNPSYVSIINLLGDEFVRTYGSL